jgi:hypothetical protein
MALRRCTRADMGDGQHSAAESARMPRSPRMLLHLSLLLLLLLLCDMKVSHVAALSSDASWSSRASGASLVPPVLFNSASATPLSILKVNYSTPASVAVDNSTLSYWMSGANCASSPDDLGNIPPYGVATVSAQPRSRGIYLAWTGQDGNLFSCCQLDSGGKVCTMATPPSTCGVRFHATL